MIVVEPNGMNKKIDSYAKMYTLWTAALSNA